MSLSYSLVIPNQCSVRAPWGQLLVMRQENVLDEAHPLTTLQENHQRPSLMIGSPCWRGLQPEWVDGGGEIITISRVSQGKRKTRMDIVRCRQ